MSNTRELLEKVSGNTINTSNTNPGGISMGGGGILKPRQANRFIDYLFDQSVLMKTARVVRMSAPSVEIDKVDIGNKIMRKATEGTDDGANANPTFSKISMTTVKLRLDWELSSESLEDNLEGPDLEDHIARLMATQAGNDIEDVLINGTGTSTGLLSAFKGFRQLALDNAHVVDANGQGLDKAVFNLAIKTLPRKYKQRRNQLRFFTGSNLVQYYLYNLTSMSSTSFNPFDLASGVVRGDVAANDGGPGTVTPFAFGIPVINVPLMDETRTGDYSSPSGLHGDLHLTFPQNFIIGIKRDVTVYRLFQPKKDTIEYTLFIRVGCAMENYDAHVIVKNIKVSGSTGGSFGSVTHGANVLGGSGTYTF